MSSKNRKFRKKVDENGTYQDQDAAVNLPGIKKATGRSQDKERKPKKVSLLSFDEEESAQPVREKPPLKEKPKPKLRPNLQGLNIKEDTRPVSTQQSGAGTA